MPVFLWGALIRFFLSILVPNSLFYCYTELYVFSIYSCARIRSCINKVCAAVGYSCQNRGCLPSLPMPAGRRSGGKTSCNKTFEVVSEVKFKNYTEPHRVVHRETQRTLETTLCVSNRRTFLLFRLSGNKNKP